jgi:zinc protease
MTLISLQRRRFVVIAVALLCLLLAAMGCVSQKRALPQNAPLESNPAIVEGVLDNGISYRILQNHRPENRILLRLVVRAGSVLEDEDQRGIAHLVEHMAFKGSAHFGPRELISYFESIGMSFGPDVNAYTSFNETVYMLEVPGDNPAMLDTALTVFQDYACALTFDPVELDKERGVVIEEWRLGRGVRGRTQDKVSPFLFNDSRYARRIPIGDPDIIRTIPRERVVDFYKKWYRPELMTVILAGDADPAYLEQKVAAFLGAVPGSEQPPRLPDYPLEPPANQDVLILADPESPYTVAQVYSLFPGEPLKTRGDFQSRLTREIAGAILTERLQEKAQAAEAPFLDADAAFYRLLRPLSAFSTAFIPKDGRFQEAFRGVLDELDRFRQFGATESELVRQKDDILADARDAWQNRDKTESAALMGKLINGTLNETPVLAPDKEYELTQQVVKAITVKEVNAAIAGYFSGRGTRLIVTAPESVRDIPGPEDLRALWLGYHSASPLLPPDTNDDHRPLFDGNPQPGEIVSQRTLADDPPIWEFTLSNGSKVVLCQTDFKADTFQFDAVSRGGLSLLADQDYPSALEAPEYLELSGLNGFTASEVSRLLAGKNLSMYPRMTETNAGLRGSAPATEIETFFQLINLYFTAPYFSAPGWERLLANYRMNLEARKNEPSAVFIDQVVKTLYGGSVRHMNANEEFYRLLDSAKAESFYSRFFSSPGNFTFVFTGDLDAETVKDLSCQYIASLPQPGSPQEAKDNSIPFPQGKPVVKVQKGLEPQSQVLLLFGGSNPAAAADVYTERELITAMENLVDIRLMEVLREKMGGAYSVGVSCTLLYYPSRRFLTQISFGCDPSQREALTQAVLEELGVLQTMDASETDITKLKETFLRSRETAVKTNAFWHNRLVWNLSRGDSGAVVADPQTVQNALTPAAMRRMIGQYFSLDNYLSAFLLPE